MEVVDREHLKILSSAKELLEGTEERDEMFFERCETKRKDPSLRKFEECMERKNTWEKPDNNPLGRFFWGGS